MEAAGLIQAMPYQERPVRYSYALTEKGRDLGEVLASLARWGKKHIRGTVVPKECRKERQPSFGKLRGPIASARAPSLIRSAHDQAS